MHHLVGTGLRCAPPTWVVACVVHHGVIYFMFDNEHANQGSHCSSVPMYTLVVHNISLYQLGSAQDDFACSFINFLMVYNAVLSVSVGCFFTGY